MVINVKSIMNVGLAAQSLAIAGESIKLTTKKPSKLKKLAGSDLNKSSGDIIKAGMTTIVGAGLLVPQAKMIGSL